MGAVQAADVDVDDITAAALAAQVPNMSDETVEQQKEKQLKNENRRKRNREKAVDTAVQQAVASEQMKSQSGEPDTSVVKKEADGSPDDKRARIDAGTSVTVTTGPDGAAATAAQPTAAT